MNKYVLRTSLVWAAILALMVAAYLYHSHEQRAVNSAAPALEPGNVAPAAAGPAATGASNASAVSPPAAQTPLAPVQLTPERMQSIGVTTGTVEFKQISDDIRATGNIDIDERLVAYAQVRFPGYIRQVFVNATYQYVRKGEPLFTIYSPDLVATQQEYLLARQSQKALSKSTVDGVAAGADTLAAAAEQRLRQWEVPQNELNKLKATGKPITDLTINSPASGYVTERNALPNMYVEPSTRLYTIADLSRVWVYAQIFQDDVGRLRPGDPAQITVDAYPGRVFRGRVDTILPQVDLATRTVRVRLAITNPGLKLKPGMFVNVDLKAPLGRALTVTASAVLQSGSRAIVFLDLGEGHLQPQDVDLGPRAGDNLVVLKGLHPHQRIVTSANFLIDSESQLQAAAGSFIPPAPGSGGAAVTRGTLTPTIDFSTTPNPPAKGGNVLRVKLTNPSGSPIDGAQVTVAFFMPAMPAMGMPAMKTLATLAGKGGGIYEGACNLSSGGVWQVSVTAQQNGKVLAAKQLSVNATGGM